MFFSVIGVVLVIEGLPYFCFPNQLKTLSEKLPEIKNFSLRFFGLLLMLIGLFVVYLGRKG